MKKLIKVLMISGLVLSGMLVLENSSKPSVLAATIKEGYRPLTNISARARSVKTTGNYGLYTKPGTTKGAKLVASKSKMKQFGTYNSSDVATYQTTAKNKSLKGSTYFFHAYGYAITNTGSVYYKVVSMNGKYRGYVYGGKKSGTFAGGIKSAKTTKSVAIPQYLKGFVGIESPGILWNVVPYTQYKSRQLAKMTDFDSSTIPHLAKFKIDKAAERTREKDMYFHMVSQDNYGISGWVNSKYVGTYSEILNNWGITD